MGFDYIKIDEILGNRHICRYVVKADDYVQLLKQSYSVYNVAECLRVWLESWLDNRVGMGGNNGDWVGPQSELAIDRGDVKQGFASEASLISCLSSLRCLTE